MPTRLFGLMIDGDVASHVMMMWQVMDVGHVSTLAMVKHIRSPQNQAEFEFNSLYAPETIGKARHSLPTLLAVFTLLPQIASREAEDIHVYSQTST